MTKFLIVAAAGAFILASPASANHAFHLDDPFASRGACEAERNALSNDDDWLIDALALLQRRGSQELPQSRLHV
jgi:hypothetical protein